MTSGGIERAPFGTLPDGTVVERVTLRGEHGFEAAILPFGAAAAGAGDARSRRALRRHRAWP